MYKKQNKVSFLYEPVHYSTIKSLQTNELVKRNYRENVAHVILWILATNSHIVKEMNCSWTKGQVFVGEVVLG